MTGMEHPNQKSQSPGGDILRSLYVNQKMSYKEIAAKYGVSDQSVMRWIKKADITPRTRSEATKIGSPKRVISDEYREKLRANIAKGRKTAFTPEALAKRSEAMKGRVPTNKGERWTPGQREKLTAIRKTDEHREKLSQSKRGEKNGQWRGGVSGTDERLKHWSWKQARKACYARDNWTCQECGVKCNSTTFRIQAHHIVPRRYGGTDDLDNLTTLCVGCHRRVEARVSAEGTYEYLSGALFKKTT